MKRAGDTMSTTEHVDLAAESDFALGEMMVRPPACEVECTGVVEKVEPRIMQVLVALARASGAVVSRDELIRSCWGGVIVGDDAIIRVIGRIRRLSRRTQAPTFAIETISKVGYRLVRSRAGKAPSVPARLSAIPSTEAKNQPPLIAVLPFDNQSDDPSLDFFTDGLSDEIMQRIARIPKLQVVGRASSFQFRGINKTIRKITDELHVSHILDGAVRREGNRLRMSAQLIDASNHLTLWSSQYDRELSGVFAVQEDIAAEVARTLALSFAVTKAAPVIDAVAHELYLRGRDRLLNYDRTPGTVRLLEEATERAPEFAAGWATLARALWERRRFAANEEAVALGRQAREAARRALDLDPKSGAALAVFAGLEPVCGRFEEMEATLLRALDATPEDISVLGALMMFYLSVGQIQTALRFSAEAYRLDPLHAKCVNWHSMALVYAGQWPEGRALAEDACRRWPEAEGPFGDLVFYAALNGDWPLVDRWMTPERRLALVPRQPRVVELLVSAVDILRRPTPESRSAIVKRLRREVEAGRTPAIGMLVFASMIGDVESIYEIVEACSFEQLHNEGGRLPGIDTGLHPLFIPYARALRADPRFLVLCTRLGLTRYWRATGRWPDCAADAPYLNSLVND